MTTSINSLQGTELPAHPNLENLRKQAKSMVKAFRQGEVQVCGILKHLKKFHQLSAEEILRGKLCLSEAQHALAVNYGFGGWKELQDFVEAAPAPATTAEAFVKAIIVEAAECSASDIHLEWTEGRLQVRLRVDGILREIAVNIPNPEQVQVINHVKAMAKLDTTVDNQTQQGIIRQEIGKIKVYLRVSVIPYVTGESIVIRLLSDSALSFKQIDFSAEQESTLRKWISQPNGIIIFSGPGGSGKTTTMYTSISEIDSRSRKIVTAEDSVWQLLKGVNQMQINPAIGLTYTRAIHEQLHQDPDVMVVGDCRDQEVLQQICQAALMGHLIFTQMDANSAPQVLKHLLDMGGNPYSLGKALVGIVSQRLVRRICRHCKEQYELKDWERTSLQLTAEQPFFRGKGCEQCNGTGYRGRTAICEMLEMNDALRTALANHAPFPEIAELAAQSGMISLKQSGLRAVFQGITTLDEVLRICP